jgi:iron chelate uptake ABC transporter, feCT family, permease protein
LTSQPLAGRDLREQGWYQALVFAALGVLLLGGAVFALGSGTLALHPGQVLNALFGETGYQWHGVVWDIRLPRVLVGALVGMNLATSGVILQAVMSNPLADPGIIGVSSGAGLTGMVVLLALPQHQALVTPVAFCGAMLAAVVIYALAWRGGIRPMRVILAGVAVSALCGAGISAVMVLFSDRLQGALLFMNGAMTLKGWSEFGQLWPYSLATLLASLLVTRQLDVIVLGDDVARGVGMNVQANRLLLTAIAALLAASAVSVVGLLGFVGLIVPHIMRLVLGTRHQLLTPGAIVFGAALVMISDTISRTLFSPIEIPVGIMMAVLGVPFFLFLLRRAL